MAFGYHDQQASRSRPPGAVGVAACPGGGRVGGPGVHTPGRGASMSPAREAQIDGPQVFDYDSPETDPERDGAVSQPTRVTMVRPASGGAATVEPSRPSWRAR